MTTTHRITTIAAAMLSLAAAGSPTATARQDSAHAAKQRPASVYSRPDKSLIPVTTPSGDSITGRQAPRRRSFESRRRRAALTGATPASAPPAGSPSPCSASVAGS